MGYGIDLSILDEHGLTALHIVLKKMCIVGIPDDSPELNKVQ